ncbi:MAG TPA: DUF4395 domain-containing protein [Marmoricola sp.]|nr:DUF4395 domain-containing protein [Marmoricola sp.]
MSSSPTIDPRGPRFTASVTVVLLIAALLSPRWVSVGLLSAQALFFAIGLGRGVQFTPTGLIFRRFIRPRLTPPADLEDARPPRFAQGVGLAFALVAVAGYASGATVLGAVAAGFALAAAVLNAVFGFCLGCEMYLLIQRIAPNSTDSTKNKKEAIA